MKRPRVGFNLERLNIKGSGIYGSQSMRLTFAGLILYLKMDTFLVSITEMEIFVL